MAGLDDLLGGILGAATGQGGAGGAVDPGAMSQDMAKMMAVAGPFIAMFARSGGLQDLLGKLSGAGLADQANSWVGTGENAPVDADQIAAALPDEVSAIAQQAGLDPTDVSASLSQILPGLVSEVTPNGQLPANPQEAAQVLDQIPGGDQLKAMLGLA